MHHILFPERLVLPSAPLVTCLKRCVLRSNKFNPSQVPTQKFPWLSSKALVTQSELRLVVSPGLFLKRLNEPVVGLNKLSPPVQAHTHMFLFLSCIISVMASEPMLFGFSGS